MVESLPREVAFDLAIRLVGPLQDFQVRHELQVVLSTPQLVELGAFDVPVDPRAPTPTHIPGYEINHHLAARIVFDAQEYGGYDLSFALDGQVAHHQKTTISVVSQP